MYRLLLNSNIHFISFDVKVQDREPRPGMFINGEYSEKAS